MLPARFNMHRPNNLDDAIALLAKHGSDATPFAGGTELLVVMKARLVHYPHVVDLKRIPQMRGISTRHDGGLSIGALCTHHQLATDPVVREHLPAYSTLSGNIANIRVRVAGTLGGNLCFAEPHADPPALLTALGAEVTLAGAFGRRNLLLEDFIVGELSTTLAEGELLVRVDIPALPHGTRIAYRAAGHLERPAVGVAVVAVPNGSGFDWRFRVGAICARPAALTELEQVMAAQPVADALEILLEKAEAAAESIEASDDLSGSADYKRHLVAVLAARAARAALGIPERMP